MYTCSLSLSASLYPLYSLSLALSRSPAFVECVASVGRIKVMLKNTWFPRLFMTEDNGSGFGASARADRRK